MWIVSQIGMQKKTAAAVCVMCVYVRSVVLWNSRERQFMPMSTSCFGRVQTTRMTDILVWRVYVLVVLADPREYD